MATGDRTVEYVTRRVQLADGTYEDRLVPQYSDGMVPGLVGERSYRCVICGQSFKAHDVQMFRGKPYGVPCGCYKDIRSILKKERAELIRSKKDGRSE
jgi:hypothetical protein